MRFNLTQADLHPLRRHQIQAGHSHACCLPSRHCEARSAAAVQPCRYLRTLVTARREAPRQSSLCYACKPRCFFWIATRPTVARKDEKLQTATTSFPALFRKATSVCCGALSHRHCGARSAAAVLPSRCLPPLVTARRKAPWQSSLGHTCKPRCFFWIAARPKVARKDEES